MKRVTLIVGITTAAGALAVSLWLQARLGWPRALVWFALLDACLGSAAVVILTRRKALPQQLWVVLLALQMPGYIARGWVPGEDNWLAPLAVMSGGLSVYTLICMRLRLI